jgi:hypothetical protein
LAKVVLEEDVEEAMDFHIHIFDLLDRKIEFLQSCSKVAVLRINIPKIPKHAEIAGNVLGYR